MNTYILILILLSSSLIAPTYHRPFLVAYATLLLLLTNALDWKALKKHVLRHKILDFALIILLLLSFGLAVSQNNVIFALQNPYHGPMLAVSLVLFFCILLMSKPHNLHSDSQSNKQILAKLLMTGIFCLFVYGHLGYVLNDYAQHKLRSHNLRSAYRTLLFAKELDRKNELIVSNFVVINVAIAQQLALSKKNDSKVLIYLNQASDYAKVLVSLNPDSAKHWKLLGDVYREMLFSVKGSDLWTIAAYERAHLLSPHNSDYLTKLAATYMLTGRYAQATPLLENALKSDPENTVLKELHAKSKERIP